MSDLFHGLSVDLTTVLEKRNKDCASSAKIIAGLVTALILGSRSNPQRNEEWITEGRKWLKKYNDRVHGRQSDESEVSK